VLQGFFSAQGFIAAESIIVRSSLKAGTVTLVKAGNEAPTLISSSYSFVGKVELTDGRRTLTPVLAIVSEMVAASSSFSGPFYNAF
jgi:hypothetical protein